MPSRRRKRATRARLTRSQRFLVSLSGGLVPFLVLLLAFLGPYTLQVCTDHYKLGPVSILLSSPRYLEVHSEEEIRIALENGGSSAAQVAVALVSDGSRPVFIGQGKSSFFFVGMIQKREQIWRNVKVFFPFSLSTLGQPAGLSLWGSLHNRPIWQIAILPVSTAPIPWHRRIFRGAFSLLGAFAVWAAKEWWDTQKKVWGEL